MHQSLRNTNQRDSEAMQEHQIRPPGWHFSDGTAGEPKETVIAATSRSAQMQSCHHVAVWKHRDQVEKASQLGPNASEATDIGSDDQRTAQWRAHAETSSTVTKHSDACKWKMSRGSCHANSAASRFSRKRSIPRGDTTARYAEPQNAKQWSKHRACGRERTYRSIPADATRTQPSNEQRGEQERSNACNIEERDGRGEAWGLLTPTRTKETGHELPLNTPASTAHCMLIPTQPMDVQDHCAWQWKDAQERYGEPAVPWAQEDSQRVVV